MFLLSLPLIDFTKFTEQKPLENDTIGTSLLMIRSTVNSLLVQNYVRKLVKYQTYFGKSEVKTTPNMIYWWLHTLIWLAKIPIWLLKNPVKLKKQLANE